MMRTRFDPRRLARQEGFTVVEVLVASVILIIGVLGVFGALDSARVLALVSERSTSLAHRAQQELERLQAMPYASVAMTAAPPATTGCPSPLTAAYPTSPDCFVNSSGALAYDRGDTSKTEPLAIDSAAGTITPNGTGTGCTDGCTSTWTDGRFSGEIFDFVSWTSDPNCTAGTICPASNDYKRLTVVVTLAGAKEPSQPVLASTLMANADALPTGAPANSAQNPLQGPTTQCGGSTCNQALNGTAIDEYLTDSPTGGSYSPPTVGNVLHQTLVTTCALGLACAPNPDQLITTPPSTGGVLPPCYSTDRGCLLTSSTATGGGGSTPCNGGTSAANANGKCQTGLLLGHPSTDSTSCGSPPTDNTRSHSWFTSTIPAGTTVNLTGAGGMTAYLQSASGVAVNVLLCGALYIAPTGLLGTVVNLLPTHVTQIGATFGVNASAGANVPTPVSFGFNLGTAAAVSSTLLNQARIELVLWLAASAGTDVGLVYDHPYASTQLTLVEK